MDGITEGYFPSNGYPKTKNGSTGAMSGKNSPTYIA
jgi:hypothetical protein